MRVKGFWFILLAVFASACAEDGPRNLTNNLKPNLENPNVLSGSDGLTIVLKAIIDNAGNQSFSLSASLVDEIKGKTAHWSNSTVLGPQIKFSLGPLTDIPMVLNTATKTFELTQPLTTSSGTTFRSWHDENLSVIKLGQPNETLAGAAKSPLVLGSYPLLNIPPLTNRILSNCNPDTEAPDYISWANQSFVPIKLLFASASGELKTMISALDSTFWQMNPSVYEAFYSASELLELETPPYYYDDKEIELSILRTSNGELTFGAYTMPVQIQTIHQIHYKLEYQGGCGL